MGEIIKKFFLGLSTILRHTRPMLIDLYLQGRLDLDRFVTETITLHDVEEAFHKMERGEVLRSVVVI